MSKRYRIALIFFLIISISLSMTGCKDSHPIGDMLKDNIKENYNVLITKDYNGIDIKNINQYDIDINFNPKDKTYVGNQEVMYVNNEDKALEKVYFHLYPNTFKQKETAPFLFNNFKSAYPNGFIPGYIDIEYVKVNKEKVNYNISGKGDTILRVDLPNKLSIGDKINISMKYKVKLPPAEDRFGYGDKTFNFGNWYPVIAVYDDEGWNLDPYYTIGDPFYSDVSNYNIKITAPKDIQIATSGKILSEDTRGENRVWKIESKLIRDFAWVASKDFEIIQKDVEGTKLKVYFLKGVSNKVKEAAVEYSTKSLKHFNEIYGKYPYGQYSVVQTSFPSGMEYPGIVFIGDKYYSSTKDKGILEIIIVHETAHQWWYGVIGNDEVDEAWLDESLATYSEYLYALEEYGEEAAENYYTNSIKSNYEKSKVNIQKDEIVLKPLSEFEGWGDYGPLVYSKGAMMIYDIQQEYGKEKLYTILQTYYQKYKFKNATTMDFIRIVEEITGESMDNKIDKWLYGRNN